MTAALTAVAVAAAATACAPPRPVTIERIVRTPRLTAVPPRRRGPVAQVVPRPAPPAPTPRHPSASWREVGMSYYAEGAGTSSGEPFDPYGRATCATATARPLLRFVTLRNPGSGRTERVWLNDTGSFGSMVPPRTYDCVPFVWRALGFDLRFGVVRVEVSDS